jgi:hypothetical protein
MIDQLVQLADRIAVLEQRLSNSTRYGTVAEVDPAAGTVRLDLGNGTDGPFLSPPMPYSQMAGSLRVHAPPSVGQQMVCFAPGGDIRQATAIPMTWGGDNANPGADGATNVLRFGNVTISLNGSGVTIQSGGSTIVIGADGLAVTGGVVTHNGTDIGDTHRHGGVVPGMSPTQEPI